MSNSTFRYSALNTYANCPRQYMFKYEKNIEGKQNQFAEKGTLTHSLIEDYTNHCVKNKVTTDYDFLDKLCRKYSGKNQDFKDYFINIYDNIKNIDIPENVLETEKKIETKMFQKIDLTFHGTIDLLYFDEEDNLIIRDYKTGYKIIDSNFQFEVYAWLASKVFNFNRIFFEVYYINDSWHWKTPRKEIEQERLSKIETVIANKINDILEDNDFKPHGSDLCNYCPYLKSCLEIGGVTVSNENLVLKDEGLTKSNIHTAISFYERVKIFTEHLENKIAEYCKENGSIETENKIYGIGIKPTISAPNTKAEQKNRDTIVEILKSKGFNPIEFAKINMTKLKPFLKNLSETENKRVVDQLKANPVAESIESLGYNPIDYMNLDIDKLKENEEIFAAVKDYLVIKPNDKFSVKEKNNGKDTD